MLKPEEQKKKIQKLEEMDRIAKLLIRRDFELMKIREKREEEFKKLEKLKDELEDAKTTLEIKVNARTRELIELAQSLDQKVKKRTIDLEKGKNSNLIYLPGFYCAAGIRLNLRNVGVPQKKVKLKINKDVSWFYEGEKFLDDKCKINRINIKKKGQENVSEDETIISVS